MREKKRNKNRNMVIEIWRGIILKKKNIKREKKERKKKIEISTEIKNIETKLIIETVFIEIKTHITNKDQKMRREKNI